MHRIDIRHTSTSNGNEKKKNSVNELLLTIVRVKCGYNKIYKSTDVQASNEWNKLDPSTQHKHMHIYNMTPFTLI